MNQYDFRGKVALVTGGVSGIGAACVHAFVRGGAKVAIVDRDQDLGAKTLTDVREAGGDVIFLPVDVAQPEAVEAMVADTIAAFGHLDIAVNNAGIGGEPNPTGAYSIEGWQKVIDVNLNGVFYCMRYEIPAMLAQGGGVIVNMASILGTVGFASAPARVSRCAKNASSWLHTWIILLARPGVASFHAGPWSRCILEHNP